jgi:hypothetical protein
VHQAPRRPLRILGEQLLQQRGVDRARTQRVDANPAARVLNPNSQNTQTPLDAV